MLQVEGCFEFGLAFAVEPDSLDFGEKLKELQGFVQLHGLDADALA